MRFLINNFLKGCLVLVPIVVTLYAVYLLFTTIDGLLPSPVPGGGILITVALVTAIGVLAGNVVGRTVFGAVERLLKRLPVISLIYRGLRDFVGAVLGQRQTFDRPVVVELSGDGQSRAFGFVTRDDLSSFGLPGQVAVYFPQSVNFAGHLLIFPRERVRPLDVDSAEVMAFIVSGGVTGQRPESIPP
ncbi:MAG: DUF502 domain-containing protein [Myxococcales bacterium]|nr:DUF502 domain-containing protein [Myxococcales bacterium]